MTWPNTPVGTIERMSIPEPNSGCWLWLGWTSKGYGGLGKHTKAHRFSYEAHHGPIPRKMQVLHRCDVTCCVNPDHLFLGTQSVNMADMVAKGRAQHYAGEMASRAILTWDLVREIRARYVPGVFGARRLAKEYPVHVQTIRAILHKRTWKE